MKKILIILAIISVFCTTNATAFTSTDYPDGHYWETMITDTQKGDFILGYMLGRRYEMELTGLFAGIIKKYYPEVADDLVDSLNVEIEGMRNVTIHEIVSFLNEYYGADRKNLNIPIVNMINFCLDSQNMTKKQIKEKLNYLSEVYKDKKKPAE